MRKLLDYKEEIHKCSKCGLCQADCPIYKITGNDCSVSRGHFLMLEGLLNGDFKMTKTINRYLDLCLKCGACSKSCPDVVIAAKSEYFKAHPIERFKTLFLKFFVFGLIPRIVRTFVRPTLSKTYDKKVLFFGGCGSKLKGDKSVVKILNSIQIEVVNPCFHCCGIPYFTRGDLGEFVSSIKSYIKILKKHNIKEVVTTCASCEKTLKDYVKWADDEDKEFLNSVKVRNIYEYLAENNLKLKLNDKIKVTYHKPCNINNFSDIERLLKDTENLEYLEMEGYDRCCGLNGISKLKEYKIMSQVFSEKHRNIEKSGANIVIGSADKDATLNEAMGKYDYSYQQVADAKYAYYEKLNLIY